MSVLILLQDPPRLPGRPHINVWQLAAGTLLGIIERDPMSTAASNAIIVNLRLRASQSRTMTANV